MLFLVALLLLGFPRPQPTPVRITVRVLDVRPVKGGVLHVGLHREPGVGFPGPAPQGNQDARVVGTDATLTFLTRPGIYAVAVHHDANTNGKMDTNFFGIPKEGYGISNDPRPRFRAPRFDEARVVVSHDTSLVIRMAY